MVKEEDKVTKFLKSYVLFCFYLIGVTYPFVSFLYKKNYGDIQNSDHMNLMVQKFFTIHEWQTAIFLSLFLVLITSSKRNKSVIREFALEYIGLYVLLSFIFMIKSNYNEVIFHYISANIFSIFITLFICSEPQRKTFDEPTDEPVDEVSDETKKGKNEIDRIYFGKEEKVTFEGKDDFYKETKYITRYEEIKTNLKKIQNKEYLLDIEDSHIIKKMSKELETACSLYNEIEDKLLAEKEIDVMFTRIEKRIKECLHSIDKNRINELKKINMQYGSAE